MKVSVITAYTPTPENRGGISALIYSLLAFRPQDVDVKIYTYNMNHIPKEECEKIAKDLNAEIEPVSLPKWYNVISSIQVLVLLLSVLLKSPLITYVKPNKKIVSKIKNENGDFVWVYPYFFYRYAEKLPQKKFVVTGCDCISNVISSRFADVFYVSSFKRSLRLFFAQRNAFNVEENFKKENIRVHYVGMQDYVFFTKLHSADNAFFLLHPHYALENKVIQFNSKKIKVLFAGAYNHYMINETAEIVSELVRQTDLQSLLEISFLGKDWEPVVEKLKKSGYECNHVCWVENYARELVKYDVQVVPISNGGGTKGKVLDSIGNGLLTIGSYHALENICVRHMDSCIYYRYAYEVPGMLRSVALNRRKYEKIAEKGRSQVRKFHDPVRISRRFFSVMRSEDVAD